MSEEASAVLDETAETGDEAAAELGDTNPGDETGDEAAAELGEADPDGDDTADAEGV